MGVEEFYEALRNKIDFANEFKKSVEKAYEEGNKNNTLKLLDMYSILFHELGDNIQEFKNTISEEWKDK